jgi:hypothetical protein
VSNSPEVLSTLYEDKLLKQSAEKVHPFSAMIKDEYIPETKFPRTPILVCKTSNSMIFKLPVFKPKIPEEILLEDPKKGVIASMAIYGKRASNTDVSVTSTDLTNTGIHYSMNSLVRIPNLSHNSKYSFAVAGYDVEENLSNQIGDTLRDVHTSQPMPINLLYNYLAKIAFQLDDTETALKAARNGCEMLVEKSLVKERLLNGQYHPVMIYRLDPARVRLISGLEMRAAAEGLLIWSLCLSMTDPEKGKKEQALNQNISRDRQKEVLEISNLRLLAIELAIPCQAFDIARITIIELYNSLGEFFQMKTLSRLLFQVLTKVNMALSLIPSHFWDDILRKVSAKLSYQLICLSLQLNEFFFSKRILYTEIKIPRRKYGLKSKVEMVEYVDPAKVKKGTAAAKPKKPTDPVEEEEKKMVPQFTRDIAEKNTYQPFFEEFLLTVHEDFYNFTDYFQDYWTDHLNALSDKLTSEDKLNAARGELNRIVDFYSYFFDVGTMKAKIESTSAKSDRFLEYLSKLGRRLIEINTDNELTKDVRKQIGEYKANRKPDDSNALADAYVGLKFRAYDGNIDWNPAGLIALIQEEEVNQTGNKVAIEIFTEYFDVQGKLISIMEKNWPGFRFSHLWNSEISYLNANSLYLVFRQQKGARRVSPIISPCDINELDIDDVRAAIQKDKSSQADNKSNLNDTHLEQRSMAASARSNTSGDVRGLLKSMADDHKDFTDGQNELIDKIFEFLALAAVEAYLSRCYRQLQNILISALNILVDEAIKPNEMAKRESWKHLMLLIDCSLMMVQDIKDSRGFFDDDTTNIFGSKEFKASFFKIEKDNDKGLTGLDPLEEKKKFWFQNYPQLKIQSIANMVGFISQVLLIKEKWNVLISLTKTLSNVTSHFFSKYTLPFTIAAQEVLVQEATDKKNAKMEDKRICEERHRQWQKTREKSRQAKIKAEIPKEQIQYTKDVEVLNEQIKMCKYKETLYKGDKEQAISIKKDIDSEVKESLSTLKNLQRQVSMLVTNDRRLQEAFRQRIVAESDHSRRGIVKEAERYIKEYKQLIDGSMRKKKETFLATIALHDLGNLCYLIGDTDQATVTWNEAIDQVFQKSSSLKGFRDILTGTSKTVQEYGLKELLIVVIVLGKLALYSYFKDVNSRKECILMACGIAKDLLHISLEHPQSIKDLGIYSLSSLGVENLFSERKNLDANDLLFYASQLCTLAIDFEAFFEVLPLACLCEYLANHQINSAYYSAKSKLYKSLALSSIGLINESIINLLRVFYEKDFPLLGLYRNSESLKLKIGVNYSFSQDMQYQNDLTPNDTRNSAIIDKISDLKLNDAQFFRLGPGIANLFNFAKYSLLFSMLRHENLDIANYIDLRRAKLEGIIDGLGDVIKRLIFEEKLSLYQNASNQFRYMSSSSPEFSSPENELKFLKIIESATAFYITSSDYPDTKDHYMKVSEVNLTLDDQRRDRGTLFVSCYILQSRVMMALNNFSMSYSCLRDCLSNLDKLAQEKLTIEYNPPVSEFAQDEEDPKGKKKPKEDKKPDPKKQAAATKKKTGKGGAEEEFTEEDFQNLTNKLTSVSEKVAKDAKTQRGIQSHLWLKVKAELAHSLFFMKRWTGLLDFIERLNEDSNKLNDTLFKRKSFELKCRTLIIQGKKSDALEVERQIKELKEKNFDKDVSIGTFLADLGEYYFLEKDYVKALDNFQMSKEIILKFLRNYLEEFDFSNVNAKFASEKIVSELIENKYDIEQKLGRERIEKGGKTGKPGDKQKQKKDDKKQANKDGSSNLSHDIGTLYPMGLINLLKDQKLTMIMPDEQQEKSINSSVEYVCIYSAELELYAKINHRICQTLMVLHAFELNSPSIITKKPRLEEIIQRIHTMNSENSYILRKNYFINTNIKMANEYLIGKALKFEALFKFSLLQAEIIDAHHKGHPSSKVHKILQNLPHKNFSLRKLIIKVPMFTKFLRDIFLPILDKAKGHLLRAIGFLKGECLLQEFTFQVSDIFYDLSEIDLLIAEYRPNLSYRFVSHDEIRQYGLIKGQKKLFQDQDIYEKIDVEMKKDNDLQRFLIWEAIEYIKTSINVDRLLKKMREEYNKLGDDAAENFVDVSKMNKDIRQEILEARKLIESVRTSYFRRRIGRILSQGTRFRRST